MKLRIGVLQLKKIVAVLIVAVIMLCGMGIKSLILNMSAEKVSASTLKGRIILIDPGHGGFDSGASANGVVEKDINLSVAEFLKKYIEAGGGSVYMTRDTDTDTADENRPKGITQKKSDLQMRKSDIKKYDADLFISIHMNKFEKAEYRGAQVFYEQGEANEKLAEAVQNALKNVLNDGNKRMPKATGDGIFILKNNEIPSALIECGFLSNPEEAALLQTSEYQKKIAEGIYIGILKFFSD